MSLSPAQINSIAQQVYRQFPEVKNVTPAVQDQAGAKAPSPGDGRFVLTFRTRGQGPAGQAIPRVVRVVANERGKVLKVSTSR